MQIYLCMSQKNSNFAADSGEYSIPRKYIIEKHLKFLVKFFKL